MPIYCISPEYSWVVEVSFFEFPDWTRIREYYHVPGLALFWPCVSKVWIYLHQLFLSVKYSATVFGNWSRAFVPPSFHLERAREQTQVRFRHTPHSLWHGTGRWLECWLAQRRTTLTCYVETTVKQSGGERGCIIVGFFIYTISLKVYQSISSKDL